MKKYVDALREGRLVVFPTETVYGLGASMERLDAVEKIYEMKRRPKERPLMAHISSIQQAETLAHLPEKAYELMEHHWPGPLTLVVKKKMIVSDKITSGLDTIALRMPAHPLTLQLIEELGHPLIGTSANISGEASPTKIEEVPEGLGDLYLDGGETEHKKPSTLISLVGDLQVLRVGAVTLI